LIKAGIRLAEIPPLVKTNENKRVFVKSREWKNVLGCWVRSKKSLLKTTYWEVRGDKLRKTRGKE